MPRDAAAVARDYVSRQEAHVNAGRTTARAPRVVTTECGGPGTAAHFLVYVTEDELATLLRVSNNPTGEVGPAGLKCLPPKPHHHAPAPPVQVKVFRPSGEEHTVSIAPDDTAASFVDAVKSETGQGGTFLLWKEVGDTDTDAVLLNPDAAPLGDVPAGTTIIDDENLDAPMAQFGASDWVLQPYEPESLRPARTVHVTLEYPDVWQDAATDPTVYKALGDVEAPLWASDGWDGMIMVEFSPENTGAEDYDWLLDRNHKGVDEGLDGWWHYRDRHGDLIKLDNHADEFDERAWTTELPRRYITLPESD